MRKLTEQCRCIVVVRVRGNVGVSKELEEVFRQMHLTRKNHATLISDSPSNDGTLRKVKDYATWGGPSLEVLKQLVAKRGMLTGNKRLTDDYVKEHLGYGSLNELSEALYETRVDLRNLKGVKPLFRLNPPRKGFQGSTKKPYSEGALGNRKEAIDGLLKKMI